MIPVAAFMGAPLDDPPGLGYVNSLARQRGDITDVGAEHLEFTAKRLRLWRNAFPEYRFGDDYGRAFENPPGLGPLHRATNHKAAKAPGLVIPPGRLGRADGVIE